jgi:hypothetical protein
LSYERPWPDSGEVAAPAARNSGTIHVVYLMERDSESINYSWLCVTTTAMEPRRRDRVEWISIRIMLTIARGRDRVTQRDSGGLSAAPVTPHNHRNMEVFI